MVPTEDETHPDALAVTPQAPAATILVIDDDEGSRVALSLLCEHLDYRVLQASGGAAGIAAAATKQPDCIVLDLCMPGLSGFDVLRRLKSRERTREIPVIIFSGAEESARNVGRALSEGAVDYVSKQLSTLSVAIRVRSAVERRRVLLENRDLRVVLSLLMLDTRESVVGIRAELEAATRADSTPEGKDRSSFLREIAEECDALQHRLDEVQPEIRAGVVRAEPTAEPVDLLATARAVAELLRPRASARGIQLTVREGRAESEPPSTAAVFADVAGCTHAVATLLRAAVQCSEPETSVDVDSGVTNGHVELSVTYRGDDIPGEALAMCGRFADAHSGSLASHHSSAGRRRVVLSLAADSR